MMYNSSGGPPLDWRLTLCIAWKTSGRGQALGLFGLQ
jgi:hypothetical protein